MQLNNGSLHTCTLNTLTSKLSNSWTANPLS